MAADAQTWKGWQAALAHALGAPNTDHVHAFLSEWAATEPHKCSWNPLGATLAVHHSRHCKRLAGNRYIQAYPTHVVGIAATVKELREPPYPAIVRCLLSGDPFSFTDWELVVGQLGTWGALRFAKQYRDAMSAPTGGGGGPGPPPAGSGDALRGYHSMATTLARHAPRTLYETEKLNRATLALLHHRR